MFGLCELCSKKSVYHFLVPHNNEETEAKEKGSGDISH